MVDVRGDDMAQIHAVPGDEADGDDEEHDSCGQPTWCAAACVGEAARPPAQGR